MLPQIPFSDRRLFVRAILVSISIVATVGSAAAQPRPEIRAYVATGVVDVADFIPVRPVGLTEQILGIEDELTLGVLEASHPFDADSEFQFVITALPAIGALQQSDGTPISFLPCVVTDPAGAIGYLGAPDSCSFGGAPVASFEYVATHVSTHTTSLSKEVSIVLAPVYDDMPQLPRQISNEDSTLFIQLPESVEGRWHITEAFDNFGILHQVEPDDISLGATIIPDAAPLLVTNANRWIAIVPALNQCGLPLAYFSYVDTIDQWPQMPVYQSDWRVNVDYTCVNDAPVSYSQTFPCANDLLTVSFDPTFHDVDGLAGLTGQFTQLPQFGRIYRGSVAPENEVTLESNNWFDPFNHDFIYLRDAELLWTWGYGDQALFRVSDGALLSNEATIALEVYYRNMPPTIEPETTLALGLNEDGQGWAEIIALDDQGIANIAIIPSALPQHGEVFHAEPQFGGGYQLLPITLGEPLPVPLGDEFTTWKLVYVPDADFNTAGGLPDEFRFIAQDSHWQRALDPALPAWQNVAGEWTIAFTVAAINDTPVINGPATTATEWSKPAVLTSISISDDAESTAVLRITISSTNTTFTFVDLSGVNVISQTPSAVTFEGTLTQINAALVAGIEVPSPGSPHVSRHLLLLANDLGSSGSGGPLSALRVFEVLFQ